MTRYSLNDVRLGFRWLGHQSYTELGAFHPAYRPGREFTEWNRTHDTFPKIHYAHTENDVIRFARVHAATRMVCWSLNPRAVIQRNWHGHPRSTRESEVCVSQNLLLDFDFHDGRASTDRLARLERFLGQSDAYFLDLGLQLPVRAFSGRGYHLLLGYPPLRVAEHPDLTARLRLFRDGVARAFRRELDELEVELDRTQSLAQRVKMYGTSKPRVNVLSRFYGQGRVEDEALRDHLVTLDIPEPTGSSYALPRSDDLPAWFPQLLEQDRNARNLWDGVGKPPGTDASRSGYDYSLVRHLLRLGHTDLGELATILAARANGAAARKGDAYIRRTIAKALLE